MFETLYYFSSQSFSIVEIKRLDCPKDAPKSEVYHWLLIDQSKNKTTRLTFEGMDDHSRSFKEGKLSFDGSFNEINLKKRDPLDIQSQLRSMVTGYLSKL